MDARIGRIKTSPPKSPQFPGYISGETPITTDVWWNGLVFINLHQLADGLEHCVKNWTLDIYHNLGIRPTNQFYSNPSVQYVFEGLFGTVSA